MENLRTKVQWRQQMKLVAQGLLTSGQIERRSAAIMAQLDQLPQLMAARSICVYVSLPEEVQTHDWIRSLLTRGHVAVAVPYCAGRDLHLVWLQDWSELRTGRFGILEPADEIRHDVRRQVAAAEIDVFVVPGRAFTTSGIRLGNGWGFYDRLLQQARPDALTIGVGFSEQMVAELPSDPHDVRLQLVLNG
jgi:5-formyltetrahydrofolate cyclo-ligase